MRRLIVVVTVALLCWTSTALAQSGCIIKCYPSGCIVICP